MGKLRRTTPVIGSRSPTSNFNAVRLGVRVRADIADQKPGERFRSCCRYRQFHFPNCVQARRRMCLDGGSVAVGAQRSDCAGEECNSVPFDLASTDRSVGYRAPMAACSSNQVTRIAKILDATLAFQALERKKVIHFPGQDFPDLVIVIQPDCWRRYCVQT